LEIPGEDPHRLRHRDPPRLVVGCVTGKPFATASGSTVPSTAGGHRFLYNGQTLEESLFEAGFATVERAAHGSSRHPELRRIEAHETYPDSPDLPHVIVVDGTGRSTTTDTGPLGAPRAELEAADVAGQVR
jgi:hypothetical protein